MPRDWPSEILRFWFEELGPDRFWTRSDAIDQAVRSRFADLLEEQRGRLADAFLDTPEHALAAIILFDQFPRNLFRGKARAFATDEQALAIAKGAIERGFDEGLDSIRRQFLYMPFMHSEKLADQERSVALFTRLGIDQNTRFAREHHDLIARFGRFPHRNAALGRKTLPEEEAAVKEGAGW